MMSSSEREPRLPWLLSLTGAGGVPHIPHRSVILLLGFLAFEQLVLAVYSQCRVCACKRTWQSGVVHLSMQDASTAMKKQSIINWLSIICVL